MGREIKRVIANFDWPIDKLWEGYINPHYKARNCINCDGTGLSGAAKHYRDQWYGYVDFDPASTGSKPFQTDHPYIAALAKRNYPNCEHTQMMERNRLAGMFNNQRMHHLTQWEVDALIKADRLYDFTRVPLNDEQVAIVKKKQAEGGNCWLPESNGKQPTAAEVNEWSLSGMAHDGINQWVCSKAFCKKNKMPSQCDVCNGNGHIWDSKAAKKKYDAWESYDPPAGEWYQLWTTTSEGSPMTPPFATPEELAAYCADEGVSTFGSDTANYETWLAFIRGPGWAPSMIGGNGKLQSGVEAYSQAG